MNIGGREEGKKEGTAGNSVTAYRDFGYRFHFRPKRAADALLPLPRSLCSLDGAMFFPSPSPSSLPF